MTERHIACLNWIRSISPPGVTVFHQHQNAPAPELPYVALTITGGRETATHRGEADMDGAQEAARWVAFTLAMQAFGGGPFEAHHITNWIADRLDFSELRIESLGRRIVFNAIANGPTELNTQAGGRWEARGLLDLQMSELRTAEYQVGVIEEAHFEGLHGAQTITGAPSIKP